MVFQVLDISNCMEIAQSEIFHSNGCLLRNGMLMNVSHLLEEWMTNILTRGLKGARTAVVPRLLLASGIQWRLIIQCPLQLCWLARQALDLRSLCKAKNFGYFSLHFMEIILKCLQIHVKFYKFYR